MPDQPNIDAEVAVKVDDWIPIETAPKDGTMILGCKKPPPPGDGFTGRWTYAYEQGMAPVTIAWRSFHPNQPGKKTWRIADGKPYQPSHWQRLPEPPSAALAALAEEGAGDE